MESWALGRAGEPSRVLGRASETSGDFGILTDWFKYTNEKIPNLISVC